MSGASGFDGPFVQRDLDQAKTMRASLAHHLELAEKAEAVAAIQSTPGYAVLKEFLKNQIEVWAEKQSWVKPPDAILQAEALRSRAILAYLDKAEETAKQHRAEAESIAAKLEKAIDGGRIPRVEG